MAFSLFSMGRAYVKNIVSVSAIPFFFVSSVSVWACCMEQMAAPSSDVIRHHRSIVNLILSCYTFLCGSKRPVVRVVSSTVVDQTLFSGVSMPCEVGGSHKYFLYNISPSMIDRSPLQCMLYLQPPFLRGTSSPYGLWGCLSHNRHWL